MQISRHDDQISEMDSMRKTIPMSTEGHNDLKNKSPLTLSTTNNDDYLIQIQAELAQLKSELHKAENLLLQKDEEEIETLQNLRNEFEKKEIDYLNLIEDLQSKCQALEVKRKQLHNALQELKGNIRIYVRCRPFLRGRKAM
jgi:kinesin family protein C1